MTANRKVTEKKIKQYENHKLEMQARRERRAKLVSTLPPLRFPINTKVRDKTDNETTRKAT